MRNLIKNIKKSVLLASSTGVLFFGMVYFSSPYPVFADDPLDQDNDGIADADDNCPEVGNPRQFDLDHDGIGVVCDVVLPDQDNDGITDADDNCPDVGNPNQYDLDRDGIGIVCDLQLPDKDNDGITDVDDNCPDEANPKQYDLDQDGIGIICDDDTIDDQVVVQRALNMEVRDMSARQRAIAFEAKDMAARERAIAFEVNAMAALERERAAAIRFRQQEMRERNAPGPMVGCEGCHSNIFPGVRQVVGANGDFDMNSHHVQGAVVSIDCLACHYTGDHRSGIVKLVDPDQGTNVIYEYDSSSPEQIESFCLNCHDSDGSAAGLWNKPFSDEMEVPDVKGVSGSMWADSAHANIPYDINSNKPVTCLGDGTVNGCHANAHGAANYKILAADAGTRIDQFCYSCHPFDPMYHHPVNVQFNDEELIVADGFTLQCTTCHNPHVVTGKVTDMANQLSPITTPDFDTDPATRPYAMGTQLDFNYQSSFCLGCHFK